jgi:hypothetical protein
MEGESIADDSCLESIVFTAFGSVFTAAIEPFIDLVGFLLLHLLHRLDCFWNFLSLFF